MTAALVTASVGCGGRTDDSFGFGLPDATSRDPATSLDAGTGRDSAAPPSSKNDAGRTSSSGDGGATMPLDAGRPSRASDASVPSMRDAGRKQVTMLFVTPADTTVVVGDEVTYQVWAAYSDSTKAEVTDQAAITSLDTRVVSVFAHTGKALSQGSAKVIVSFGGQTVTAVVNVQGASATVTSVEVTALPCVAGQELQVRAVATLSNGRKSDVTYSAEWASDSAILSVVGAPGQFVCLSKGTAVVSATASGMRGEAMVTVTGPTVTRTVITGPAMLRPSDSASYLVLVTYDDGNSLVISGVNWSVSDPTVIKVDKNGTAYAGAVGSAVLSADFGKGLPVATKTVRVSPALLTSIAVTPATLALVAPAGGALTATGTYSDGAQLDITSEVDWSSDGRVHLQPFVGFVVPDAVGSAVVWAKSPDGRLSASTQVTVSAGAPTSVTVNQDVVAPAGVVRALSALLGYPGNARVEGTEAVTWHLADASIATISEGRIIGVKPGTTTYYASYGSLMSETHQITISSAQLSRITFGDTDIVMTVTSVQSLIVNAFFDDGSEEDVTESVTYAVGTPSIVSVSHAAGTRGQLTALSPGVTTITATLGTTAVSTSVTVVASGIP